MHSSPGPTHVRVARVLHDAQRLHPHELASRIVAQQGESAVLLLHAERAGETNEWSIVGMAGTGLDQSVARTLSTIIEEVLQSGAPALRRAVTSGDTRDGDVLLVPVERADGLRVGVLIVMRYRRFDSADIDFYRLLGLSIPDLCSRGV